MLRTDHRSHFECFAFTRSTDRFLHFFSSGRFSLLIERYVSGAIPSVGLLCCSQNAPGLHFFRTPFQSFPQKQVNIRNTEHRVLDIHLTSGTQPILCLTSVMIQNGRHSDVFLRTLTSHKNQRFHQMKKMQQVTPENMFYYFQ